MNIDETIRKKCFKRQQLEILAREAPLNDELQIFINKAVDYGLSLLDQSESETEDAKVS